ncbi:MAG: phosphatidylglycerol lysyltransferase domain-containing protein [Planctomycetaceae bacterium]
MTTDVMNRPDEKADSNQSPAEDDWSVDRCVLIPRDQLTDEQLATVEKMAFQYGEGPESYDIVVSESSILFTPCGQGVLSVLPDKHYWHVPGGILAPAELKPRIVRWLQAFSQASGNVVLLHAMNGTLIPSFEEGDWEINMLGIEPTIELGDVTWSGSKLSWVRRQTSFCERNGLEVVEIVEEKERLELADELIEILMEDLSGRAFPKPLKVLEGEFDPHRAYRRRIFVARNKESKTIEGFLACTPMRNGTEWAFETYRKRDSATRGTMAYLFRRVVDALQEDGAAKVSLCLVPGKYVDHPDYSRGPAVVRRLMSIWYHHLAFLFNVKGQDHFKQRFRPQEERRYSFISTKSTPGSLFSFLKITGATTPNVWNVTKNIWHGTKLNCRKWSGKLLGKKK